MATTIPIKNIPFINGSPQNPFVSGRIDLAIKNNFLIGGDDFKTQEWSEQDEICLQPKKNKMKSVLVDFPVAIPLCVLCVFYYY